MSKKANPTVLGIFIFAGLILAVGGLLLFTSTRYFTQTAQFIVYFESSLNGLKEGAPVKYRGVTIGSVTRVMIHFNQATNDSAMPVILEVEESLVRERLSGPTLFKDINNLSEQVGKGLRANLETESLVTGVLFVNLEVEDSPPPPRYHQLKPEYPEIPSRPTEIQAMLKNLSRVDLAGLEHRVSTLISNLNETVTGLRLPEVTTRLTNVLDTVERVVATPDLTNSFTSLRTTLDQYGLLATKLNQRVDPLADGFTNVLYEATLTLAETRGGIQSFNDLLAPDSPLRHELTVTLDQLAAASQAVATLAEFLHNHPNALLTGRRILPAKP